MKRILFATIMVLVSFSLHAQPDPVRAELDHIFQYINKSFIPTGYLNEYGPVVVEKTWINGVLSDSNFIYDIDVWNLIYNDIENSKINPAVPAMKPLDSAQIYNELARYDTATMLTFFTANYDVMREDAVLMNLFTVSNNQLFDVPGRTLSPYMTKHIFAAAPVLPESPFDNEIRIAYKPLFFGNTAKTISKVQVDFLDGSGYQNIFSDGTPSQVSKFYYDSTGYKRFAVKVTYTDATSDECYSRQLVRVNTTGATLYRFDTLSAKELSAPVHRIQPATYINASPYVPPILLVPALQNIQKFNQDMKIYIRYSSLRKGTDLDGEIVKPLIVVEGYDITDASRLLKAKNYGINDLINEWDRDRIKLTFDFNKKLDEEAGYDLIFLDYYTMRSITENADYLLQAIDWINSQKKNNTSGIREQNVVMGISMGGLVSRYALAKRTKQLGGNPTETKMLITMDSPHQGANVPLGLQHFLYDLGEARIIKKLKDRSDHLRAFYKLNNEPATQQQLIWRVTDGNGNRVANTFLAAGGPYRTMVDYNEPYQFVAVSNGSQCGQQIMPPGSLIMERSGHVAFASVLGLWLNNYKLFVQVNALPAYGTQAQICYVKMEKNVRLLLGAVGTGWKTTSSTSSRISPSNTFPWDGVPGGTQDVTRGGSINDTGKAPYVILNIRYLIDFNFIQYDFSFVPLTSALDVQNVTVGTFAQQFVYPANGNLNGSRSDKYIAQENLGGSYNTPHPGFTARNSRWIFDQMEALTYQSDCNDYCGIPVNLVISGDEYFCPAISGNYSIPGLPANAFVSWSVLSKTGSAIPNTPDSDATTLTRVSNGWFTLKAAVTDECGHSVDIQKEIYTGVPQVGTLSFSNSANEDAVWCSSHIGNYFSHDNYPLSDITGYQSRLLSYPSMSVVNVANHAHPETPDPHGYVPPGWYIFELKASNACGTSAWLGNEIESIDCSIPSFKLIVSPNPAKGIVRLNVSDEASEVKSIGSDAPVTIELHSLQTAVKRKQWRFTNNRSTFELNISDIEKGMYLITVRKGKWSQSTKLMID